MSKARQLADLGNVYDDGALSNRNLIINGAMQVAQRGTSAVTTSGGYPVDRWSVISNTNDFTTVQDSDVPSGANTGFVSSVKIQPTSTKTPSSSTYSRIGYSIEGYDGTRLGWGTGSAQPATVSFWVKSSVTGTYSIAVKNNAADKSIVMEYTINGSSTWEYKTITIPAETSGTWLSTNGRFAYIDFWLAGEASQTSTVGSWQSANNNMSSNQVNFFSNTANTFYLTGVQLEIGDGPATPFEHRSISDELARCQRYFWQAVDVPSNAGSNRYGFYDASPYNTSPTVYGTVQFPVKMRAAPTFTVTNISSFRMRYGNDLVATNYNFHGSMNESYAMPTFVAPSNIDGGRCGWVEAMANAKASFDAEL